MVVLKVMGQLGAVLTWPQISPRARGRIRSASGGRGPRLGFGRIAASEIEAPNTIVNMVGSR